jgi:hypothetical protein
MHTDYSKALHAAARTLFIDSYWDDDRHRAFSEETGRSPIYFYGQQMEEWPLPPVPAELVAEVADLMRRTERAWGKSFEEVADLWGRDVDMLAYRCMMQTVGHGIGPNDDGDFPDDIDPSPISTESPAYGYVPEVGDWTGVELPEHV